MRKKVFRWIARITFQRYILVLIVCLGLTFFFGVFAKRISIETTWRALIPEDNPSTKNFEKILEEFGAATQIIVAIDGPNKERIIQAAHELEPLLKNVPLSRTEASIQDNKSQPETLKVVKRIDFRYDTAFIASHGFMLEKAKNLEKTQYCTLIIT